MDKDCELHKIVVFNSYLEANINAQVNFLAGGLIGILVLVLTLFYERVFDVFGRRFLGLIPFAIILGGVFCAFSHILKSIKDQHTKYAHARIKERVKRRALTKGYKPRHSIIRFCLWCALLKD